MKTDIRKDMSAVYLADNKRVVVDIFKDCKIASYIYIASPTVDSEYAVHADLESLFGRYEFSQRDKDHIKNRFKRCKEFFGL